ncbi:olfactory receptor 52P1-like, partial [Chelonoidis abingdonii]|uniref:olfactory receptor 52P1-like n=1 Tax=Chelonoidis abingdonii TaxID=106734 RepID=UPI0013F187B8
TQMYFIHCFSAMESGILVAMALDRYVAICDPLRHSTTLTNLTVAKIVLTVVLRSSILVLPNPFLVWRCPYYRTNIIPHTYCDHIAVVKLACADISVNNYYGQSMAFFITGLDGFFIIVSYSHLCVILAFYIPSLFSILTHRFGHNVGPLFHVLIANVYLLVPPMLNPIIYRVRTKTIRNRLLWISAYKGI